MSFTSYSGFRQEVADFLTWTDFTTAQLDSLIRIAEPMVNSVLRVREMEKTLLQTVTSAGEAAVPTDYLEMKNAYIDGTPIKVLGRASPELIFHAFPNRSQQDAGNSRPVFARQAGSFIFGPAQGEGDLMKGVYYGKPASSYMADSQTIHATFSAYAQVYLFAAAVNSEPYIGRDERVALWKSKYDEALALANGEITREAQSGPLTARVT